ncbi:MAG: endonuclease III [Aquificaceae bacterium]|nr:endonuclease III [Aquificaceae bacterium]
MGGVKEIIERLEKVFPDKLELNFSNALELLVAVVLAAQATDKKVNQVTESLFKKYRNCEDYLKVPIEELERDISSINYYRNKAKFIKSACQKIMEDFGGEVPDTMEGLTSLPGIGRKSANIILYNALGKNEGIAVDTHVTRVSQRLGLTKEKKPEKIEQELMKQVPREQWGKFANLLILLGRYVCTAQKPKHHQCPLYDICPSREL